MNMLPRESLIAKEMAQAENIKVGAKIARIQLAGMALELKAKQYEHAMHDAQDFHYHYYPFNGLIAQESVDSCIATLGLWSRLTPGCSMDVVFNSAGGQVMAGLALFDYIRHLSNCDHHVTTSVLGHAASMAGILLQAGTRRVAGREAYVLIHEISGATVGKIGDIEDMTSFMTKVNERIVNIFVNRSGGKISTRTFKQNWSRKDWWLDSDDLLKFGMVDEVC